MKTVVIEISGGVVQEVYADDDTRVIVVDWDDHESAPHECCAGEMKPFPLSCMPSETEREVQALSILATGTPA